jgi:hypothetical protein
MYEEGKSISREQCASLSLRLQEIKHSNPQCSIQIPKVKDGQGQVKPIFYSSKNIFPFI